VVDLWGSVFSDFFLMLLSLATDPEGNSFLICFSFPKLIREVVVWFLKVRSFISIPQIAEMASSLLDAFEVRLREATRFARVQGMWVF